MGRLHELHEALKDRVKFLMIHIREAHGGRGDLAQDRALIQARARGYDLPFPCVLDGAGAEAESAFKAWPLRLVVLAPDGRVAYDTGASLTAWDLDAVRSWLEHHTEPPALAHGHGRDGAEVQEAE